MATYGSKQYLLFELMFCCIFDTNLLFEIVFFPNIQNNIFYLKEWDLWKSRCVPFLLGSCSGMMQFIMIFDVFTRSWRVYPNYVLVITHRECCGEIRKYRSALSMWPSFWHTRRQKKQIEDTVNRNIRL